MPETINGTIDRVTFHNPQNGFAVLRVALRGRHDLITVVGSVAAVTAGEHLEATGAWTVDAEHGPQFRADQIRTSHPASPEGIERYLASGAIRSIGPQLAARIVAMFKEQTLEVFDKHSDMLRHVRGIGQKRLQRIRTSWREQQEVRRIMLFLQEYGLGSGGRAVRIYRTYGEEAVSVIKSNPYQLADDVRGIGFKTADELAGRLGIQRDASERVRAGVRYALQQLTLEGHCGYPTRGLLAKAAELLEVSESLVEQAVNQEVAAKNLVLETQQNEPWLFLLALHASEVGVAQSVRRLANGAHPLPRIDVAAALEWVQKRLEIQLSESQQEAIRTVCSRKVVVITGGPGVGKTTLVKSVLEIFAAKKLTCVLAAPTGRAAKRLAETTQRTAKTVHRLLEFDPATGDFRRNQRQPLVGDLFVLDETSMVDVVLGNQFLRAVPPQACVVLVGDADQLPSVGPGTLLRDLIESEVVPVVRLREIFRQSARSRIVVAARDVNLGQLPSLDAGEELEDFYFVEAEDPPAIQGLIVRLVSQRIPDRFGLNPLSDIQVLAPMHRGLLGSHQLNELLQGVLNPPEDSKTEIERFGVKFRVGDRVIQTENNYQRDVFNGDLGFIEKINRVEQEATVNFDGKSVTYDFADMDELSLAYVLSIHKSQGSEYPCVIVPLHAQHYMMLRRNLLYTAITRGKRLVVLVGTRGALRMAVQRQDTHSRCTALVGRLKQA